jgi:hypothetical protein
VIVSFWRLSLLFFDGCCQRRFQLNDLTRYKKVEIQQQIAFDDLRVLRSAMQIDIPAMRSTMEFGARHFALVLATYFLPKTQRPYRSPERALDGLFWHRIGEHLRESQPKSPDATGDVGDVLV